MVANIGSYQPNTSFSNFQQNSVNNKVGTAEQEPKLNQVQPREAAIASTQKSNEQLLSKKEDNEFVKVDNKLKTSSSQDSKRGSFVDIKV